MAWYLRTASSTDHQFYDSEDRAIKQVQMNIGRQKSLGRNVSVNNERIEFHEKSGALFDVMWVEDEDGKVIHVPLP